MNVNGGELFGGKPKAAPHEPAPAVQVRSYERIEVTTPAPATARPSTPPTKQPAVYVPNISDETPISSRRKKRAKKAPKTPSTTIPPLTTIETTLSGSLKRGRSLLPNSSKVKPSPAVIEVDFYRNPTILSRLILNQKYGRAIQRVYTKPSEARVWVCSKRETNKNTEYSIRQLPIHIACNNLICTHDAMHKKLLNELLSTLIFSYPEGAHERDHRNRLPLHEALWYGVEMDTIALFLMAKPEATNEVDHRGRSLADLNKHRSGLNKEAVQHLLNQSPAFWKSARAEASLRLRHGTLRFPSEGSVSSTSVLASLTVASEDEAETEGAAAIKQEEIPPLSWEQMERRSLAAEQMLTEINERNYELSNRVDALTTLDQVQGAELMRELARLDHENLILSQKLHGIERLLKSHLLSGDRLALAEISSLAGLSEETSLTGGSRDPILSVTRDAKQLCKELTQNQRHQRERIRKAKLVVEDLIARMSEGGESLSALTSHSSESDLEGDPTPFCRPQIDDLDVIFRFAAEQDHARRLPLSSSVNNNHQDPDNLDAMVQRAASQDSERDVAFVDDRSFSSDYSPATPPDRRPPCESSSMSPHHRDILIPPLFPAKEENMNEEKGLSGTEDSI